MQALSKMYGCILRKIYNFKMTRYKWNYNTTLQYLWTALDITRQGVVSNYHYLPRNVSEERTWF